MGKNRGAKKQRKKKTERQKEWTFWAYNQEQGVEKLKKKGGNIVKNGKYESRGVNGNRQ